MNDRYLGEHPRIVCHLMSMQALRSTDECLRELFLADDWWSVGPRVHSLPRLCSRNIAYSSRSFILDRTWPFVVSRVFCRAIGSSFSYSGIYLPWNSLYRFWKIMYQILWCNFSCKFCRLLKVWSVLLFNRNNRIKISLDINNFSSLGSSTFWYTRVALGL